MRVLSLGAGVQSSTLLLLACEGELQIDAAVFADTQWESAATYRHLAWLEAQAAAAGIPVERVTAGSLRADALRGQSESWMPLHARNLDGRPTMLKRQCTRNYKVRPIRQAIRRLMTARGVATCTQVIGISLDEVLRMRTSDVQYLRNEYPLVDRRMTRADCLAWMARRDYPTPPKSACIACPFHDDRYWRELRDTSPVEWADAVDFDTAIRNQHAGASYVHRGLVPLAEADIRSVQERGQLDLFENECAGVCGV